MSSKFVLVCTSTVDGATTAGAMATGVAGNPYTTGSGAADTIRAIATFIESQAIGSGISIVYTDTSVAATGLITFTGDPVAAETMTVGNVTFTARASGASGNEFNYSAGDTTTTAVNLAAAVNASSDVAGIVSATSALGVVTFTSLVPGTIGNAIDLTESMTNTSKTAFASGAESHRATLALGV